MTNNEITIPEGNPFWSSIGLWIAVVGLVIKSPTTAIIGAVIIGISAIHNSFEVNRFCREFQKLLLEYRSAYPSIGIEYEPKDKRFHPLLEFIDDLWSVKTDMNADDLELRWGHLENDVALNKHTLPSMYFCQEFECEKVMDLYEKNRELSARVEQLEEIIKHWSQ